MSFLKGLHPKSNFLAKGIEKTGRYASLPGMPSRRLSFQRRNLLATVLQRIRRRIRSLVFNDAMRAANRQHLEIERLKGRVEELEDQMRELQARTARNLSRLGDRELRELKRSRTFSDILMRRALGDGRGAMTSSPGEPDPVSLLIVTGADSSHFKPLLRLLTSITVFEPRAIVLVYDLGLTGDEAGELKAYFGEYEVRRFDYARYPEHFDIRVAAGQYAWKPAIIHEAAREHEGYLVWLDAGDLLVGPLRSTRALLSDFGLYSPSSGGDIRRWTHPATLERFAVGDEMQRVQNRNGALVGLDTRNPHAMEIIRQWCECAMNRDCIAPAGSDRSNHRQDQAILSILFATGTMRDVPFRRDPSVLIHQD